MHRRAPSYCMMRDAYGRSHPPLYEFHHHPMKHMHVRILTACADLMSYPTACPAVTPLAAHAVGRFVAQHYLKWIQCIPPFRVISASRQLLSRRPSRASRLVSSWVAMLERFLFHSVYPRRSRWPLPDCAQAAAPISGIASSAHSRA